MEDMIGLVVGLGLTAVLLVVGFVAGSIAESRHYESIRQREQTLSKLPTLNFETLPPGWQVERSTLVSGSAVVSLDYFKRFLAGLRGLIGGRVRSYESLLDRARRESILRMKEEARAKGYNAVLNVRLETSRIAAGRQDGKGTAGVEILAYGTALLVRVAAPAAPRS